MKNENVKIAKQLLKIAKELKAGGGAGIDFQIKDADSNIIINAIGTPDNLTFNIKNKEFKINSFKAEGYDDGI